MARIREQTNDGAELVDFLVQVVRDEREPTRVRIEAAGELLDRGFGRAPIAAGVEVSVVAEHSLMALSRRLSAADMEALEARAQRYDRRRPRGLTRRRGRAAPPPDGRPSAGAPGTPFAAAVLEL